MTLEWLVLVGCVLAALVPLARGRGLLSRVAIIAGVVVAIAGGAWRADTITRDENRRAAMLGRAPREGRPGGFTTSDACQSCHPAEYASWHASYHRTMTQQATTDAVRGRFDVTLDLDGSRWRLAQDGGEFQVNGRPVSLVTGSHHMQVYWLRSSPGNEQDALPFTWLIEDQRWVPRRDVFLFTPTERFPSHVWNTNCIICHATYGQPRQDAAAGTFDTRVAELGIACESCHGPAERHVTANASPLRRWTSHLTERADETIFNPGRADHVKSSEACAQCHGALQFADRATWAREGVPFRPGGDLASGYRMLAHTAADFTAPTDPRGRAVMDGTFWPDGMLRVSGREFSGMEQSGCYQRGDLSCLSCHALHAYADRDDQLAPGKDGDGACAKCHASYVAEPSRHTHHAAASSGSRCYDCHMPHTAYGLLKAIRSHAITSPTVEESVRTGRPNACNLCHLDRTLAWTADALHAWYGQPTPHLTTDQASIAASVLWALTGDAGQRALIAWHMGWDPALEVSGRDWIAPLLAELLADPYAAVRYIAGRSIRRLPGFESFFYDYVAPPTAREEARTRAREEWRSAWKAGAGGRPALLLDDAGVRSPELARLVARRDDRPVELLE